MSFEIEIDKEVVSINKEDFEVKDVEQELSKVASLVFYWGSIAAKLKERLDNTKTEYKHGKSAFLVSSLTKEPRLAEWKCKAAFESTDKYRTAKSIIEHYQRLYDQAWSAYEAFRIKSNILQTIYRKENQDKQHANYLGKEAKENQVKKIMKGK